MLVSLPRILMSQQRNWTSARRGVDNAMVFQLFRPTFLHLAQGLLGQCLAEHACHDVQLACPAISDCYENACRDVARDTAAKDGCGDGSCTVVV